MLDHIFRQYDIRGKVGSELFVEDVYDVTRAIVYYFIKQDSKVKTIIVGADGRTHSPIIKKEVIRAIRDSGLQVLDAGMCTTPVVYFSLFTIPQVDAGLMITASHNGKEYNGIKICLGKESVWGEQVQEIKNLWKQKAKIESTSQGSYESYPVIEQYITWLHDHFSNLVGMDLKVMIDCGNGAAGTVIPQLVERMKWKNVQVLFAEVDGNYPNHEADPTIQENMQDIKRVLQTTDIELGIGFDGDCDRMAPMTKSGELVQGDKLLALYAQPIIKEYENVNIVFDIKCSSGLEDLLNQWGAHPRISPSGHSIIKGNMKKYKALLAGELSCHFFFHDRFFGYDDGVYAALRLFELLTSSGKTLEELLRIFPKKYSTREIRMSCSEESKKIIVQKVKETFLQQKDVIDVVTIDGIRVVKKYGWGMIRASNTQPVICLRFEGDSPEGLNQIKQDFVSVLGSYFEPAFLDEQLQ